MALISYRNLKEFLQSQANDFKAQLPHPICFRGSGWKVRLSSISLLSAKVLVPPLMANDNNNNTTLIKYTCIRDEKKVVKGG